MFAPKQKFVVVADLGTDMVKAYVFNAKSTLPIDTSKEISIKLPGGAGPRHIAFHPKKPVFYVMSELNGMVSVHAFTKRNISILQRVKADSISKQPGSADIHVSADGKFLYASNRAEANNISVFSISAFDGRLTGVGQQSTLGKTPRNFCLDPTGKFLLAANQNSNNIVVFRIDPLTGMPVPTGQTLSIPSPVCIVFGSK
jgi:6-phosphogluconolactonase